MVILPWKKKTGVYGLGLFLALALFLSAPVQGANPPQAPWLDGQWPFEKSDLPPHEDALYGRLSNGFRYIIQPNQRPRGRISIHLAVQAGSLMETDEELGVAHFLEHLAFNGSKHFPPGALIPFFQENGMAFGRDANAHTAHGETVYKLNLTRTDDANLEKALLFFRDVADGLNISPAEVEKERGVILSEKAARDSEKSRASQRYRDQVYHGTRFVNTPIGTEEIIKTVSAKTIRNFYQAWYRPELMFMAVVGDLNPGDKKRIEGKITAAFDDFKALAPRRKLEYWGDIRLDGTRAFYDPHNQESISLSVTAFQHRTWENDSLEVQKKLLTRAMIANIISRRFQKMKSGGGAPFLSAQSTMKEGFKLFPRAMFFARCEKENWEASLQIMVAELNRTLKYGFLPQEVAQVKRQLTRGFKKAVDRSLDNRSVIKNLVACINGNRVYQSPAQTHAMFMDLMEEITADSLHRAFKAAWDTDNRLISLSGNGVLGQDKKRGKATLMAAYEKAMAMEPKPPVPVTLAIFPYLKAPKKPGKLNYQIQKPIPGTPHDLHEVEFTNGLVLRMIPTPLSPKSMALKLHLGQGLNGVSDEEYVPARMAFSADGRSGFGSLSTEAARQIKGERGIFSHSALEPRSVAISGHGDPREMEGVLAAMWAQYRDPDFRPLDHDETLKSMARQEAEARKTVGSAAREDRMAFFHGRGLRTQKITLEQGQKYTTDQLRKKLKAMHRGGAPVLNAVGDFDPQKLTRAVGRYFGAMELGHEKRPKTTFAHTPIFPRGKHLDIRVGSQLNQALLEMAWFRPVENLKDRRAIAIRQLAAGVIRDRLRKRIREEMGASYSPAIRYWYSKENGFGYYKVSIATQPKALPGLEENVTALMEKIKATGISQEELDHYRAPMATGWDNVKQENKFYFNTLNRMARDQSPLFEWASEKLALTHSLTRDQVNKEIATAFVKDNLAVLSATEAPAPQKKKEGK